MNSDILFSDNEIIPSSPPVLVDFTRGPLLESRARGWICVVDSDDKLLFSKGDPTYVTYLRSTAKPLQAVSVLTSGAAERFRLSDREIALICGSHSGEDCHTETVRAILAKAGLDTSSLKCGTHPPLDPNAKDALIKAGLEPQPVHHNCSGKHSGMLLTASHCGESLPDYLDPASPTQQRIVRNIALMAGIQPEHVVIGIDGCSAPVHGLTMRAAALALARLIEPEALPDEFQSAAVEITRSMRAYPEMVAGTTGRICTELMRLGVNHELIAKAGAEGYYGAAWRDPDTGKGIGLTVKIEDGSQRSRDPVVIAVLQKFSVLPQELNEALKSFSAQPIKNWAGLTVGEIIVRL